MDRDTDRYRNLTRRALVLGGFKLALIGTLGARMYHLQVREAERYQRLAEENRINMRLLPPSRGLILDRFGVPLAENRQNFRVVLVPEEAGEVEGTLDHLARVVPIPEADRRRVLRDAARLPGFMPIMVRDTLDWDHVSRLEVNAPELPGLSIDVGELRHYPFDEATAHVLGYVGAVTEEELNGDPVLTLPGFRIGKTGAEYQHEGDLRGAAGASQVEVNAYGRVIRELSRDDGTPGKDVRMALDIGLQEYVQERLKTERSASAAIMDIHRGDVFALASHPSFDPNLFTTGISSATWRSLLNDPYAPLTNKVIAGQYAPGSTFKMLVCLAALEDGRINENHTVWCPGHMTLGNHRFHCWKRGGHGWLDMIQSISQSCDVFFYDVARRIGVDKIAEMANRLGLGSTVGLDLPGEQPGLIPTRQWKSDNLGQPWQQGETLVAAIGQGYVLATPLQLCVMQARMVNGGKAVVPRLTYPADEGFPEWPDIGVSEHALQVIFDGMQAVTTTGTARNFQIPEEGLEMGGKTGTSQVRRITMAERATGVIRQQDRPWRDRHHGLFVGFAPLHAPRYACAVVVEHGGSSAVAAPIARDILHETQRRNPAVPMVPRPLATADPGPIAG